MGILIDVFAVPVKETAFLSTAEIFVDPACADQGGCSRYLSGVQKGLDLAGCAIGGYRCRSFEPCENFGVRHRIGHGFFGTLAQQ